MIDHLAGVFAARIPRHLWQLGHLKVLRVARAGVGGT